MMRQTARRPRVAIIDHRRPAATAATPTAASATLANGLRSKWKDQPMPTTRKATTPTARKATTPATGPPTSYDDAMATVLAEMGKSPDDLEARSAAFKTIRKRWPHLLDTGKPARGKAATATTRTPAPSTGGPTTYAEAMAAVLAELGKSADDLDARSEAAKIIRQRFPETLGK